MIKLNHANLATSDVLATTEFFSVVFGMHVLEERSGRTALLQDDTGFLLTLMLDQRMEPDNAYPNGFHVGFRMDTRAEVDACYARLSERNYTAPAPAKLQRGGPPAYGFFCQAPGGVAVEVSTIGA